MAWWTRYHARQQMDARLFPYRPERDVYRLLQVDPRTPSDEILGACRRLARTFHPDRNGSPRATEEMQVVNAVREIMCDPATRAEYDTARRRWYVTASRPVVRAAPQSVQLAEKPRRPSPVERYLRATWVALRTTVGGLVPARCAQCRMVIASDDAYCAGCGGRLLAGGGT